MNRRMTCLRKMEIDRLHGGLGVLEWRGRSKKSFRKPFSKGSPVTVTLDVKDGEPGKDAQKITFDKDGQMLIDNEPISSSRYA